MRVCRQAERLVHCRAKASNEQQEHRLPIGKPPDSGGFFVVQQTLSSHSLPHYLCTSAATFALLRVHNPCTVLSTCVGADMPTSIRRKSAVAALLLLVTLSTTWLIAGDKKKKDKKGVAAATQMD